MLKRVLIYLKWIKEIFSHLVQFVEMRKGRGEFADKNC